MADLFDGVGFIEPKKSVGMCVGDKVVVKIGNVTHINSIVAFTNDRQNAYVYIEGTLTKVALTNLTKENNND